MTSVAHGFSMIFSIKILPDIGTVSGLTKSIKIKDNQIDGDEDIVLLLFFWWPSWKKTNFSRYYYKNIIQELFIRLCTL